MEALLYTLAYTADEHATRVNAAAKLHAICDGMPKARTEHSGSLTLEQLVTASLADGQ
jgi:hypothetical protein